MPRTRNLPDDIANMNHEQVVEAIKAVEDDKKRFSGAVRTCTARLRDLHQRLADIAVANDPLAHPLTAPAVEGSGNDE